MFLQMLEIEILDKIKSTPEANVLSTILLVAYILVTNKITLPHLCCNHSGFQLPSMTHPCPRWHLYPKVPQKITLKL